MQNTKFQRERIEKNIFEAIQSCQAGVLDTFELELGDHPNWKFIRSRLLRCFGDRGLIGRITDFLDTEFVGVE